MDVMFLGAAREVTGSSYLVTVQGKHVLIDCGMEQGKDTYENHELPINPAQVDTLVLTHAHIDHSGMVPALVKQGFRGTIHATTATHMLCDIMLRDSAHIQEMEAQWRNRKAERSGEPPYEPIYTQEDAETALKLFAPLPYREKREILPGCVLSFTDAGHLLGSASVTLELYDADNTKKTLVFSGDIGNINQPIINDPQHLQDADFVVMESTYGDRLHGERPDYIADFTDVLQTTFDRGGNVVIPSFAVGRSQEVLYFLREIKERGLVQGHDGFPVYMDSPLAIKATRIFMETEPHVFDEEMQALLREGRNPISFPDLKICVTADESKQINFEKRPCVIISASGMAEAGRIRHHLKHNLWKREATILFVGYQSVGTLGRQLVDGAETVRLFNETVNVNAQIRMLRAISGHADQKGLLDWAQAFNPKPQRVFITHGEEEVALAFEGLLKERGYQTYVPYSGDSWDLVRDARDQAGDRALAKKAKARQKQAKVDKRNTALQQALNRLTNLVNASQGLSNKLKDKLAKQIHDLAKRWE
ncbi:MAG: MBL fold metallo-hydrolase [Clostridiales bacterium]|nr:MBL fold metallo-hydrolase [Clostridiales bacterium]